MTNKLLSPGDHPTSERPADAPLAKKAFTEPKLTFIEPKLTKHGDVTEITKQQQVGFFGTFG